VGYVADSEHDEAAFVAEEVDRLTDKNEASPGQVAVFYRTNAQSRVFEEVFIRTGLAYKVVGGVRFYERREVRDLLAYLRLIANPGDEVSLRRILNVPRRGIGQRAEACVAARAQRERVSFAAALAGPGQVPGLAAGGAILRAFTTGAVSRTPRRTATRATIRQARTSSLARLRRPQSGWFMTAAFTMSWPPCACRPGCHG
jgi:ATP-dependent DNA helicase UvrD/PcrA